MAAADRDDELPPEIADQMLDAGLRPAISVLQEIIDAFVRGTSSVAQKQKSEVSIPKWNSDSSETVVECWPLKAMLPSNVSYEVAGADRGSSGRRKRARPDQDR